MTTVDVYDSISTNSLLAAAAVVEAAETHKFLSQELLQFKSGIVKSPIVQQQQPQVPVVGFQSTNEIDSLMQIHRRKMLRRAANRRSAQLSRARKKAHMEDLREENNRLQRMVDILDCQPDLVFTTDKNGYVNFVSERALQIMRTGPVKEEGRADYNSNNDGELWHVSKMFTPESSNVFQNIINDLKLDGHHVTKKNIQSFATSVLHNITFYTAEGDILEGQLKCSKLVKTSNDLETYIKEENIKNGIKESNTFSSENKTCSDDNSTDSNGKTNSSDSNGHANKIVNMVGVDTPEEEFVCVVRLF
jgi:PAS domain-containing protein